MHVEKATQDDFILDYAEHRTWKVPPGTSSRDALKSLTHFIMMRINEFAKIGLPPVTPDSYSRNGVLFKKKLIYTVTVLNCKHDLRSLLRCLPRVLADPLGLAFHISAYGTDEFFMSFEEVTFGGFSRGSLKDVVEHGLTSFELADCLKLGQSFVCAPIGIKVPLCECEDNAIDIFEFDNMALDTVDLRQQTRDAYLRSIEDGSLVKAIAINRMENALAKSEQKIPLHLIPVVFHTGGASVLDSLMAIGLERATPVMAREMIHAFGALKDFLYPIYWMRANAKSTHSFSIAMREASLDQALKILKSGGGL